VLFIVSVLALFWALATLAFYGATKYNGQFCAVVDLLLVGAFIAGVYYLRAIGHSTCSHWGPGNTDSGQIDLGFASYSGPVYYPFRFELNKACSMLKASWAFGIMNIIFFFVTFLVLLWVARHHYDHYRSRTVNRTYTTRSHHSRSPRRSHHSSRRYSRTYV